MDNHDLGAHSCHHEYRPAKLLGEDLVIEFKHKPEQLNLYSADSSSGRIRSHPLRHSSRRDILHLAGIDEPETGQALAGGNSKLNIACK